MTRDDLIYLLGSDKIKVPKEGAEVLIAEFLSATENIEMFEQRKRCDKMIKKSWRLKESLFDIENQNWTFPNGTVGVPYEGHVDIKLWIVKNAITLKGIVGLEQTGLTYDAGQHVIVGTPTSPGLFELSLLFTVPAFDEAESPATYKKAVSLVLNPDPRTLWQDIPSKTGDIFWKEDSVTDKGKCGDKHFVAASKRGRSHAQKGSFRDDHFEYGCDPDSGWTVIAVSDGAGSAPFSREGSRVACKAILDHFGTMLVGEADHPLQRLEDSLTANYQHISNDPDAMQKVRNTAKKEILYPASIKAHEALKQVASKTYEAHPELFKSKDAMKHLSDFNATLIFTIFKKLDCGYIILSFGVGDCPIVLVGKTKDSVVLLNKLDVGEYGGGTRFINHRNIFTENAQDIKIIDRFNVVLVEDFSYLFLMTDGIYDPKFVVEANLEKPEKWIEFLEDLDGKNEDERAVDFDPANEKIEEQLSSWMDFFSKGNHDDRTLAVVF